MTETFDLLDRPEILQILFHPRRSAFRPADSGPVRDVRIPVADGVAVGGRAFIASAEGPVVLYFHGNGEIAADYDGIAPLYTRLGLTLLVVDFRGYGTSDGTPTASSLIADAAAVHQALPEVLADLGLTPSRVYVMGRSLGSASALEIAQRAGDGIAGLIIESGFAHTFPLIARLSGLRAEGADESRHGFGNLDKIARVTVPTLIIHGVEDWIIPVEDGEALYEHSAASEKRLVTIPNAGHNDLLMIGRRPYFEAIAELTEVSAR
jgi:hypothetical protein